MMRVMAPTLPSIRMADIEILNDWHIEDVKALGDRVPGYKSSASMSPLALTIIHC